MQIRTLARKAVSLAATLSLACCGIPAAALAETDTSPAVGSTFTEGGITYTVTAPGQASVGAQTSAGTSFASAGGAVTVPATAGGCTVTGITDYAFSNGSGQSAAVTSLTLPASVKTIGNYAFYGCSTLTTINFAKNGNLSEIGKYAFHGCTSLSSLEIPLSVTRINMYAFALCDNLASLTFEDVYATSPTLAFGEGVFYASSTAQNKLAEVFLPARINSVSNSMFEYQNSITSVRFASNSLTSIGSKAFSRCTSLTYLEIPELTSENTQIGNAAFSFVNALKTIVFTGPEHVGTVNAGGYYGNDSNALTDGTFTSSEAPSAGTTGTRYTYPDVETIVYYSTHRHNIYANANHYQTMTYYPSKADAEAGTNSLGFARIRSDIATKDMNSSLAASDSKGKVIYEGSIPANSATGKVWHYEGMPVGSAATNSASAYEVDDNDISYGEITLEQDSFTYTSKPVSLSYKVVDAQGNELKSGTDYTIVIQDTATGMAPDVYSCSYEDTYTITARGKGKYTGSVSTTFVINPATCTWTRSSGNASNATLNHMAEAAFTEGELDTVILVGRSSLATGAASAGLAGARNALILVTDDDALTTEARYNLNLYQPESVFLVGITDVSGVSASIEATMDNAVSISAAFDAETAAETSYNFYYRTRSKDYWDDTTTAVIANSADLDGLAAIGSYAYARSMPVFLTDNGTSLFEKSASTIVSKFENVILVGTESQVSNSISTQLTTAGFKGSVTRWGDADDAVTQSVEIARKATSLGSLGYNKLGIASPNDLESAVTGISTCGKNRSLLLFSNGKTTSDEAVEQIVRPNRYVISQGYLLSTRKYLSAQFMESLQAMLADTSSTSLYSAKISIAQPSVNYTGKAVGPVVTVTDATGNVLKASQDYTLKYYNNTTDRETSLSKLINPGTYTITATGAGDYSGTCSAVLTIVGLSLEPATVTLSQDSFSYTGDAICPEVTVTKDGKALTVKTNYTVVYRNNTDVGTAHVTITGAGIYEGSITKDFTIEPLQITSATLGTTEFEYTGMAHTPSVTVMYGEEELEEDSAYTVEYSDNVKAGTGTATITGIGCYSGTFTCEFHIAPPAVIGLKLVSKKAGSLTVSWSNIMGKVAGVTGYAIYYKVAGSKAKTVYVAGASKASKVLSGLTKGKKVTVKIASYVASGAEKTLSAWSAAGSVKIAKK